VSIGPVLTRLRAFAEFQPLTPSIETLRDLLSGTHGEQCAPRRRMVPVDRPRQFA